MYVDILLLAELTTGPKHGYEIKKNIQNRLGNNFELNHNMLYPTLRRFENMGAIMKMYRNKSENQTEICTI